MEYFDAIMVSKPAKEISDVMNRLVRYLVVKGTDIPRDYRGWVYIYCKGKVKGEKETNYLFDQYYYNTAYPYNNAWWFASTDKKQYDFRYKNARELPPQNARVVARFWCSNVGRLIYSQTWEFHDTVISDIADNLWVDTGLSYKEIDNILEQKPGTLLRIGHLEILPIWERSIDTYFTKSTTDKDWSRLSRPFKVWGYFKAMKGVHDE